MVESCVYLSAHSHTCRWAGSPAAAPGRREQRRKKKRKRHWRATSQKRAEANRDAALSAWPLSLPACRSSAPPLLSAPLLYNGHTGHPCRGPPRCRKCWLPRGGGEERQRAADSVRVSRAFFFLSFFFVLLRVAPPCSPSLAILRVPSRPPAHSTRSRPPPSPVFQAPKSGLQSVSSARRCLNLHEGTSVRPSERPLAFLAALSPLWLTSAAMAVGGARPASERTGEGEGAAAMGTKRRAADLWQRWPCGPFFFFFLSLSLARSRLAAPLRARLGGDCAPAHAVYTPETQRADLFSLGFLPPSACRTALASLTLVQRPLSPLLCLCPTTLGSLWDAVPQTCARCSPCSASLS